jgi:hypothetical protein
MLGANQTRCQRQQDESPMGFAMSTPPGAELSAVLREIPQRTVEFTHDEMCA